MEKNQGHIYETALKYHSLGLPVFPVNVYLDKASNKAVKRPLISKWQDTESTAEYFKSITNVFKSSKCNAIGLLTGASTDMFVLDLDIGSEESMKGLPIPPTPCQRTGSGGYHYFFKYIPNITTQNAVGIMPNVDIRADGGYVVIAPSFHPKGAYEWIMDFDQAQPADAPDWLINLIKSKIRKKTDPKLAFGAPNGQRNQSAAQVIGHVLANLHPNYWLDFGWTGLKEWNKRNDPPLPEDELERVFKSIAARQYAQRKN